MAIVFYEHMLHVLEEMQRLKCVFYLFEIDSAFGIHLMKGIPRASQMDLLLVHLFILHIKVYYKKLTAIKCSYTMLGIP